MRTLLSRHRHVLAVFIGVTLPLFLLYVHGRSPRKTTIIERALLQLTGPAERAASGLFSGVGSLWRGYVALVDVAADNATLREQSDLRAADLATIALLQVENDRLRAELDFKKSRRDLQLVAAHVIGKELSPFGRVLRLSVDVGADGALAEGMPVVAAAGLVGRLVAVSGAEADVLLTVDARSVVNVRIADKGVTGSVTGTSSPYTYAARMSYLHRAAPLATGDLVVTSGHDKIFPPGIPVGTIRSIEERQQGSEYELQITPVVNFADLELVQIVIGVNSTPEPPRSP